MNTTHTRSNCLGAACVALAGAAAVLAAPADARAGGTLTPVGSAQQPIQILDHHVDVVINNGFAKTEVTQTFFNPNPQDLEAIYSFPVPVSASLSEVTIYLSENAIHGEVLPRRKAEQIYQQERDAGNEAGLASKNGYQNFEFRVTPVRAQSEAKMRFVYYQPLSIDTAVGRYLYPLEEGGTDEQAIGFWTMNDKVEGAFSASIELKSAAPIADVRVPGFDAAAQVQKLAEGHYRIDVQAQGATLSKDLLVYYRLQENLPGRVELIPYRPDPAAPGTYMLVVTPGIDLGPITTGADYAFVLDVSGSMQGKIGTLARGVAKALGSLRPEDRFRIVTFNDTARELTPGWVAATPEAAQRAIAQVEGLRADGGTNLYDGVKAALNGLDADRAASVVLVTDGVTNTGVIEPRAFHDLMNRHDVRLFGFLMGNSANWPLMRTLCEASGGFYAGVSNSDDIIGQIMLAKSKITSECLHDATLSISGVTTFDGTDAALGKVYRGQQLVLFGRYDGHGPATVTLNAHLTGEDKTYTTTSDFPETAAENPEIERLWAMNRVEAIETQQLIGALPATEAATAIETLGVDYQLVTDYTAMVVLADDAFERHGIERRNRDRTAVEHQAQAARAAAPARDNRVDSSQPMFDRPAQGLGNGGGGALDPFSGALLVGFGILASRRRRPEPR